MPTAIAWDNDVEQLWLAGVDGAAQTVVRIPLNASPTSPEGWPRVPQAAVPVSADAISQRSSQTAATVITMALGGRLVQVLPGANVFAEVPDFSQQEATATTTDRHTKSTFVAIHSRSASANYLYKMTDGNLFAAVQ
jgi:hypothetical protein